MAKMARAKSYPLNQCRLYMVNSPVDLAKRLHCTEEDLERLKHNEGNYRVWRTKQNRLIQEPKPRLQQLHKRIHTLLSRIDAPDYLHSAIKGRSYITNARSHLHEGGMIKIDVKKFFQSVPRVNVHNFFRDTLRCSEHTSAMLASLLTIGGFLPTGSSSSPIISYYAFKNMFDEIKNLADENGLTMTCYVDDIVLSGKQANRKVLHNVRLIIAGFGLHSHKSKFYHAKQARIITGVAVANGKTLLPNRRFLLIKQQYHNLMNAIAPIEKLTILKTLTSRVHEAAQIDNRWLPKAIALVNMAAQIKHDRAKANAAKAVRIEQQPTTDADNPPW